MFGFVEDLIVKSSPRRRGIGKQLIKAAQEWCVSKGVDTLELNVWDANVDALKFYESIGFVSVQRRMSLSVED